MKKTLFFSIYILIFMSCKSNKVIIDNENSSILYILPINVEKLISEYISKNQNNNYVIDLHKNNNDYIIYLVEIRNDLKSLINNSSRKVFIEQKLIPIIFDYDSDFATLESFEDFVKNSDKYKNSNEPYIRQKKFIRIYDNVFFIKFNKKGDIIDNVGNLSD